MWRSIAPERTEDHAVPEMTGGTRDTFMLTVDGELELQVMLTRGESVKGSATEGMTGNYYVIKVRLNVED